MNLGSPHLVARNRSLQDLVEDVLLVVGGHLFEGFCARGEKEGVGVLCA